MDNKSLIKQYVSTGLRLPAHQVNRLSSNEVKTYLRSRLISAFQGEYNTYNTEIQSYEYKRMDDEMRDYLVKSIPTNSLDDATMSLNWRADSDDFIERVIRLRPFKDIHYSFSSIMNHLRSPISVINQMLDTFEIRQFDSYSIRKMLNKHDTHEGQLHFSFKVLDLLNKYLGDSKITKENSHLSSFLYELPNSGVDRFILRVLSYNMKKSDKTIDDDTFFNIMNNLTQNNLKQITDVMRNHFDLTPNQIKFIEEELDQSKISLT